ncbi:MAG: hypothetical protein M1167_03440 [Chloroflexi bacterium]|nr:hypothetical protein [Chloroflexota bacterium]
MVEHNFSGAIVSATWDLAVWSAAILIVAGGLFYGLFSSKLGRFHRFLGASTLCGLIVWVCAVALGFLNVVSLVFLSLFASILSIYASLDFFATSRPSFLKRALFGSVLVALFIELAGLVLFNAPFALNLPTASSAVAVHWQSMELSLSNLSYPLLPYAYLFFVVLGVGAFLVKIAPSVSLPKKLSDKGFSKLAHRLYSSLESCKEQASEPSSGHLPLGIALLVSIAVSSLLVVVTILPWINPTNRLVSVDAPVYYQWLAHMRSLDANSALSFAALNDRAAFLVLSYALSFIVSPVGVMQFMPALLVPLFCIASLFVVKFVCGFREAWIYVVLIAPFSIQALGLMYSGYFANMLAVIFVYVYFILFLRTSNSASRWGIPALLGASLLVLFSHSWTWYAFVFSLGAFLFLEWRTAAREPNLRQPLKQKARIVGATIIVGLFCDLARTLLTSSSASMSVFETAQSNFGLPNTSYLLGGLKLTTNLYLGGVFANGIILALCIVGFLFMLTFKTEMSRLLLSWFLVGCVAVLFASGELVFDRFLFLMPSLVFSSLGLSYVVRVGVYGVKGSSAKKRGFELLVVALVFLLLLNFGLRFTSNLNIV